VPPSINKYISVLKNGAGGDVVQNIKIKSLNQVPATELAVDVTIEKGMSESEVADAIIQTMVPYLDTEDALYKGDPFCSDGSNTPYTSGAEVPFTFRPYQSDHTVNVFSQRPFLLDIPDHFDADRLSGVYIVSGAQPVLFTCDDVKMLAEQLNFRLVKQSGAAMSDFDIANLAIGMSAQVIAWLGGKIPTATTYVAEGLSPGSNGFGVENVDVIQVDFPKIGGGLDFQRSQNSSTPLYSGFNVNHKTGWMSFSDAGFPPYSRQALPVGSFYRMSYIAGLTQIPLSLKLAAAQLLPYMKTPQNTSRLKVGSYQIDFSKDKGAASEIKSQILSIMGR